VAEPPHGLWEGGWPKWGWLKPPSFGLGVGSVTTILAVEANGVVQPPSKLALEVANGGGRPSRGPIKKKEKKQLCVAILMVSCVADVKIRQFWTEQ
jgi:hypothetical protein